MKKLKVLYKPEYIYTKDCYCSHCILARALDDMEKALNKEDI